MEQPFPVADASSIEPIQEIKCIYTNLQSILNKKTEIDMYLSENNIDLMFFTEVFFTEEHATIEYSFQNFQVFADMRYRGGACIYVRNGLKCFEIQPPDKPQDSS